MKKFLLILLIAVAVSVKVEFDGTDLENKWKDFLEKVWEFIKTIPEKLKKLYEWLKEKGIWNDLIDMLEKYGAPKAIQFCAEKTGWGNFCKDLVERIIKWVR